MCICFAYNLRKYDNKSPSMDVLSWLHLDESKGYPASTLTTVPAWLLKVKRDVSVNENMLTVLFLCLSYHLGGS
ncbi:hypothetical protein C0J52_11066 [Blattella germanica]|nr:hypothetical protein C0J52_11066 [Blattella germanica]